jgi:hypothetical protein
MVRVDGDEHLAGPIDSRQADETPAFDDPETEPRAALQRFDERRERLGIGAGRRTEVPLLGAEVVEEQLDVTIERRMVDGDDAQVGECHVGIVPDADEPPANRV